MRAHRCVACVAVALAFLCAGGWPAMAAGTPVVKYEKQVEMEVDLGMILDDFLPPLMELIGAEDEIPPEMVQGVLDLVGITALDRLHVQSSAGPEGHRAKLSLTLDAAAEGGLLGSMLAIPPDELRFGRYLSESDVVMLLSVQRVPERILALAEFIARPEVRQMAPMIPPDPLGITAPWGVDLRRDILPALSGELDLILLPFREGQPVEVPSAALVLGLKDGPAFRETVLSILERNMGVERVAQFREASGEKVGGFTFYPLWEGIGYAVGPEFGIVTTDPMQMKSILRRGGGGLPGFRGHTYLWASGDQLLSMARTALEREGAGDPEARIIAEVLQSVGSEPVGTLAISAAAGEGRLDLEMRHSATLGAAAYRLAREMFRAVPRMEAMERRRAELRGVVREVDAALTRYGKENEGVFPPSLEALVEAGYLDALPSLQPTPLGAWVDGGYTYLPLRDGEGTVVGHYFFVYGMDRSSGFDVFTAENLAEPAAFRAARDGAPDGVVSFAYDGIALEQMESW